jgi:hypothetical protein
MNHAAWKPSNSQITANFFREFVTGEVPRICLTVPCQAQKTARQYSISAFHATEDLPSRSLHNYFSDSFVVAFSEVRSAEREDRGRLVTPARMCSRMWSGNYLPSAASHDGGVGPVPVHFFSASSLALRLEINAWWDALAWRLVSSVGSALRS